MKKSKIAAGILAIILIGIYYYVTLPALNLHSADLWIFFLVLIALAAVVYITRKRLGIYEIRQSKAVRGFAGVFLVVLAVYLVGSLLSSPIVNAAKYQSLLQVEEGEFSKDIEELSFNQIPLLDRDSATLLGNRKMGSMVDMVSQFEVDDLYSQINYQDQPVRVSPLRYANLIKWFTNQKEGIPAYIRIDMATQKQNWLNWNRG